VKKAASDCCIFNLPTSTPSVILRSYACFSVDLSIVRIEWSRCDSTEYAKRWLNYWSRGDAWWSGVSLHADNIAWPTHQVCVDIYVCSVWDDPDASIK